MSKRDLSERARQQVERERAKQDAERKAALKKRRMDLVTAGVKAYKAHKMGEAVLNYHTYLKVLEDWKGVPPGGLTPDVFDKTKELSELLMISGVYWDMVRLYDSAKSDDKKKEFMSFLEKYLLFSKDMPFQAVCAESLRRYLNNEKPKNKAEFKNAYKLLAPDATKCFVATALYDVTEDETLTRLRAFRAEVLSGTVLGEAFIRWYYRNGPRMARMTDRLPQVVRRVLGWGLDRLAGSVELISRRSRSGRAGK